MDEQEFRARREEADRDAQIRRIDMLVQSGWSSADAHDYVYLYGVAQQVALSDAESKRVMEYEKKYHAPPRFGVLDTPAVTGK